MQGVGKKHIFVKRSNVYASKDFFVATTILGPCIAVCLRDDLLGYAGINHYMLPYQEGGGPSTAKYGDIAIAKLIDKMTALGSKKENLVAKVFGGIESSFKHSNFNIGSQNAEIAKKILSKEKIRIAALDVGGSMGRKLVFDSCEDKVKIEYFDLANRAK